MAYGRQYQSTRNDRRLRPDYTAALNAKLQFLPQRLEQQRAEQRHQDDLAFREKSFAQSERQFGDSQAMIRRQNAMREREQEVGMGLEAAKAGMGMAMRGGATLQSKFGGSVVPATAPSGWTPGAKTGGGGLFAKAGSAISPLKDAASKYLGHMTMGNTLGAGLIGFGAGRMFGGKNKLKKFGVGAAAGGLMGLFSGSGNTWKDAATGGLFGGLGGLF
jgi:hypothetical protein